MKNRFSKTISHPLQPPLRKKTLNLTLNYLLLVLNTNTNFTTPRKRSDDPSQTTFNHHKLSHELHASLKKIQVNLYTFINDMVHVRIDMM